MRSDAKAKPLNDADEPAPPKTKTLPESRRGAWLEDPDVVTGLHILTGSTQFELPANVKRFTLGSKHCDVMINDPSISAIHCLLERRAGALRVYDQSSHNGTFFGGRRLTTFDVRPGNTFTVAGTQILALNDEMRAAYSSLAEVLGAEDEQPGDATPSQFVLIATDGGHVLIVGEPGCDQEKLARTLHAISLRRKETVVELADVPSDRSRQQQILRDASRSTLLLSINEKTPVMDDAFASSLFSPSFQIRVVALAPTRAKAAAVLGEDNLLSMMKMIRLRPLSMRVGAIPRLLDQMFIQHGAVLRVSDLTRPNQQALQAYAWPKNLDSLREAAEWLPVIAAGPSLGSAAKSLDIPRSTLEYWYQNKLGLEYPLVPEHVAAELHHRRDRGA
jgi:pSer/pThr/pTyr-binding forkhead associated (FHA) protein